VGYQFDLGPVALRPEAVIDYTRMPTSVLRLMAGGRVQTTGLVAPFVIARAGWGRGTFETTAVSPWASPSAGQVYSISGSGFAYELGGGIGFRPSRSVELELLVAYNGASEPAVEDAPFLDEHWLSAGVGATYHF
jgi:opacity protein-like surface antigen